MITSTSAVHIANAARAENTPGYSAIAREAESTLIELRLEHGVHMVAVKLPRTMPANDFEDMCRSGWAWMRLQIEKMGRPR